MAMAIDPLYVTSCSVRAEYERHDGRQTGRQSGEYRISLESFFLLSWW